MPAVIAYTRAALRKRLSLWYGSLQTNLFVRRDPGNFAAIGDDLGAAMRWSVTF